jgi:formyltetrahydrofolate deformylase
MQYGGNILASQQFEDRGTGRFFMRVQFDFVGAVPPLEDLRSAFASVAEAHQMEVTLSDVATPMRTLILVSKFGHCLNDLLFRASIGALPVDIAAVVSNHTDFRELAGSYGVPFQHIPVTRDTKADAEARLLDLVAKEGVELVVLARYMQVLSDDTCRALSGRAINIHHSFLPSFKGARPYHQAFDRGVKLVGATAHYVTADLDEGPIIEQDVMRVDHRFDAAELAAAGRDVESQVLSRAVRWHSESRVLLNGHKTVVFR